MKNNGNLLHEGFEYQSSINGDNIAVDEGEREITYKELSIGMTCLAGALFRIGIERQDRIGILIDNGIEACTAILGILRSDACFVPLNPEFPSLRLATICDEAQVSAIVTVRKNLPLLLLILEQLRGFSSISVVILDASGEEISAIKSKLGERLGALLGLEDLVEPPGGLSECQNIEEDLAYILFTSGTTGTPKGVMIQHRSICSTIRWGCDYFDIAESDRLSNHSRLSFDVSLFDIFCAFNSGATLCPITSQGDLAFPGKFIEKMEISFWFSVPSVISMMSKSRQLETIKFDKLRAALFAGEALLPDMASKWIQNQPSVPLYNLYGPTEAAIVCTVYPIEQGSPVLSQTSIPIGLETRDSELLILKEGTEELTEPGEIGRLMICGTQVAAGYWRRPELTKEAFLQNPMKPDQYAMMYDTGDLAMRDKKGLIYFVGRRDSQIKISGYRIELGEIEGAMSAFPGIHEAAAIYLPGPPAQIVAVVVSENRSLDEPAWREFLASRLPKYMVPSTVILKKEIPRNASGKIDRNLLAQELS